MDRKKMLLRLLAGYLLVMLLCLAAMQLPVLFPGLASYESFLVALVFLYSPILIARFVPGQAAPLATRNDRLRSLGLALLLALVVFPPFAAGQVMLQSASGAPLQFANPGLSWLPWEFAVQILLVAFPEEYFYRGFLQQRLKTLLPAFRPFLGVTHWPAIALTSALFAIGHLLAFQDAARLAVFFPSLLFGWLRERQPSLAGPTLFHACCNVFQLVLRRALP